jgi:5-formyltetrahydrofolate cyclo-ligase
LARDKAQLRGSMRQRRAALFREIPDAAARAAAHLPPDRLAGARVVAGYRPQGGEMDPLPLMRRFAAAGASLALPVATGPQARLTFRVWSEGDPLAPDVFGIPSPMAAQPEVRPDIIIAPVLAFDRHGGRLGQGAGCFDRTLVWARNGEAVFAIGLAFAGQEVELVPIAPHDQGLDAILTETGYIEIRKDL